MFVMGATDHAGGTSRRGFLSAAIAAGATTQFVPFAAAAAASAPAKQCAGRPPGVRRSALAVAPDGRSLWTADTGATTITRFGARNLLPQDSIDIGDAPKDLALAANGRIALVTTGFYKGPGLAVVDLRARRVLKRVDLGAQTGAVAVAADAAYVVAGEELLRIDPHSGRVEARTVVGRDPRGLALTADGDHALVALNADAAVAMVELRTHRVVRRIATAPNPYLVAAAPQGRLAAVTHNSYGATSVSVLHAGGGARVLRTLSAGADPAGAAFAGNRTIAIADRGEGVVRAIDVESGRGRTLVATGAYPRAIATHGRSVFAADEQTGQLWRAR